MSEQGPTPESDPTPPHGTPPADDPTVATPPPAPGAGAGSTSVFGDAPAAAGDPTVAVPPVAAATGAAAVGADPGGPGDPLDPGAAGDGGDGDGPWYTSAAVLVLAGLLGLGALVVIGMQVFGSGGDDPSSTKTALLAPKTAPTTSTTVATTESRCRAGDQQACDEFSDEQLDVLCNEGATAACQVLLARRGDGVPDQTTTIPVAPTDFQLCQQGDGPACSRLSDEDVSEICGQGVPAACDEQDSRFDEADYEVFVEECRNGVDAGCQKLTNEDLDILCDEGVGAACAERDSRSGE